MCFDGGNPSANVGKTLLVMLWSPEIQRLAACPPQVSQLHNIGNLAITGLAQSCRSVHGDIYMMCTIDKYGSCQFVCLYQKLPEPIGYSSVCARIPRFLSDLCRHQQHVDSVQCRFDWNLSRFAAEAEDVDSWTKL